MTTDRRKNTKLTQHDVRKLLNQKQYAALLECQHFGWRLEFIRTPLYKEPAPVLYNTNFDKIGILDSDGQINMDLEIEVRSVNPDYDQVRQPLQKRETTNKASWKEKRKDLVPVPDNLDEFLGKPQIRSLKQIEAFGWQLHFVRRPLFQEPVPVIISPDGNKYAILERDGRINMTPDSELRKEGSEKQSESTISQPRSKIRRSQ